jgi:putative phage-type endonuclease
MEILNRTTHDVQQGTDQWLSLREGFHTASEAPSALGVGKYASRSELLRQKLTGIAPEHSPETLARFAKGHESEARARPLAEAIIGGDLYPVTMTVEVDGLSLLASLDGMTLDDSTIWETKDWNEELAASIGTDTLAEHYTVQMDQELLVSGAKRCLFTCTDGTPERFVFCWYEADEAKFAALLAGWRQFKADLSTYQLPEAEPPKATGTAPQTLPALRIEVTGMVTNSNLEAFKTTALAAIRSVNRELTTDQHFADAEAGVKWCTEVETRLAAAKEHALSQTTSIDQLFKTIDDISAEARRVRLDLTKLVTARKEAIRSEIVATARADLASHIQKLERETAPAHLHIAVDLGDFAGAIKGRRTLTSLRDACDTELARSKIALDQQAGVLRVNLATFKDKAAGHEFLFNDLATVLHKPADDFSLLVSSRVDAHKAAEAAKEAQRKADEEARIEAVKVAERQRQDRLDADRKERIATRIQQMEDAMTAMAGATAEQIFAKRAMFAANEPSEDLYGERLGEAVTLRAQVLIALGEQHEAALKREAASKIPTPSPEPLYVAALPEPLKAAFIPPAAGEPATLKLGTICERLGFTVNAAFLADTLNIHPAGTDKRAVLFRESQWPVICRQLTSHISAMAELYEQAAA